MVRAHRHAGVRPALSILFSRDVACAARMFGKTALLSIAMLTATAAAQTARAKEPVTEEWTLECFTETPFPGECFVYWVTWTGQDRDSIVTVLLSPDQGRLVLGVAAFSGICAAPASNMQVDGRGTVTLLPQSEAHMAPPSLFDATVAQMIEGTMLFLRVYKEPDCALTEYPVPLTGFSEAWGRMPRQ